MLSCHHQVSGIDASILLLRVKRQRQRAEAEDRGQGEPSGIGTIRTWVALLGQDMRGELDASVAAATSA
jgi:hypothetical protein